MGHCYRFGRFEVRLDQRQLLCEGDAIALGARAFDVLLVLIEHRGHVVTKDDILDAAWPGRIVEEANVPVQVSALRKALGSGLIATIPGQGYRFMADVESADAAPATHAQAPLAPLQPTTFDRGEP